MAGVSTVGPTAGDDVHPSADTPDPSSRPALRDGPIIITVDGPAGTGKSSVSRTLAARLGLDFLDTGAMYRAATAITIDKGIHPKDSDTIVSTLIDADLHFDWAQDPPAMLAWMKPLNERIRDQDVTDLVSHIAGFAPVREHLVRKQRIIWNQHPRLVSEGRDQGSVVFPEAPLKFFLDADARVRAERRANQLADQGTRVDIDQLASRIAERDRLDRERAVGPLVCPEDAVVIDTSELSFDQVVERLVAKALLVYGL
ncbi:MAG: (d)CMP kinase [Planctomycetota bacterium]